MSQLFGIIEKVREHTLTYGERKGKVVPSSENIVFASNDRGQVDKECRRRQEYAREHGGGGLMIHEAEWKKLGNSTYRVEQIQATPIRK